MLPKQKRIFRQATQRTGREWALDFPPRMNKLGEHSPFLSLMRSVRYLLPLLMLLAAVAWWATRGHDAPTERTAAVNHEPAPYPADFEERLARVQGISLRILPEDGNEHAWQFGEDDPELGDPAAKKGGRLRLANAGPYPANFLAFGSPAPQFFHYNLYTAVDIPLIAVHPQTGELIPGTAEAWAEETYNNPWEPRKITLYFRLNPAARYSNGRPLRAADYVLGALLQAECGDAAFEQLREAVSELSAWGDSVLSLTLRSYRPAAAAAAMLHAAEPSFYADFGSDYRTRYANRAAPTTGAYTLGRTERGRMAELVRVKDWWARDLRHYRYRFNADAVEHHFLTDEAQAWEFLLRGKLDLLQTHHMSVWQQRVPELEAAGLRASRFLHRDICNPYGIVLNAETLPDAALRRGLLHAMDMEKAIEILFCGEAGRLPCFYVGYRALSPQDIPMRHFDPAAARAAFAEAGYTEQGEDGILCNAAGERLSVRFTYTPNEKTSTLASIVAQSARRCGAEILPEPLPWQQVARLTGEGKHQLLFWATVVPALPNPSRFFSSTRADDDAPFRLHDARMDSLLEAYRDAPSTARAAALEAVERRLYELAVWSPGWQEYRHHVAHRPCVRFPQGYVSRLFDVAEEYLYWIEP